MIFMDNDMWKLRILCGRPWWVLDACQKNLTFSWLVHFTIDSNIFFSTGWPSSAMLSSQSLQTDYGTMFRIVEGWPTERMTKQQNMWRCHLQKRHSLWLCQNSYWIMAIEIVDLSMKRGDFPSFFCMFTRPGKFQGSSNLQRLPDLGCQNIPKIPGSPGSSSDWSAWP